MTFTRGSIRTLGDIAGLARRHTKDIVKLEGYLRMVKMAAGHPEVDPAEAQRLWRRIKGQIAKCQQVLDQAKAATRRSTKSGKAKGVQRAASKKSAASVVDAGSSTTDKTLTDPSSS